MESRLIRSVNRPLSGTVRVPGSKSITNRALVLAALSDSPTTITGALLSDDTARMRECLNALGLTVTADEDALTMTAEGIYRHKFVPEAKLFVGNSGTTARFIAPVAGRFPGKYTIDGVARMRERPIGDLVDTLTQLGLEIECPTGCPPLTLHGDRIKVLHGGTATIRADKSSQFLSGLLMVASTCDAHETVLHLEGEINSKPYIDMTVAMMRQFDGYIEVSDDGRTYEIPGCLSYSVPNNTYAIEPDASSASYFWAIAAITGGTITVEGLGTESLQGDAKFVDVLGQMGCVVEKSHNSITVSGAPNGLRGITLDMNEISDTVMTLAAVAMFADGSTRIENVGHIRHKETDRLSATAQELKKLGATVEEGEDYLMICPPKKVLPARIFTYDDHRMAMAFALVGLRAEGIEILDPGCVAKTFPDYFERLEALCDENRD